MYSSESKPYEDESLRGILKAKDIDLFTVLERNWERAKGTLLEHLTEYGFPTHGPSHCQRVEGKLDQLIPAQVKQNMSPIEIFILLHSVFYHDIGMADRRYPEEPVEDRRSRHHEASAIYIRNHYQELGLDQSVAFRVADICKAHCTASIDLEIEPDHIDEYEGEIRVAALAAFLRLGDIMDWASSRAPLNVANITWVAGDSYRHWMEHNLIESIRPEPNKNRIIITGVPKGDWGIRQLEAIRNWMQRELEVVQPILEEIQVNYSTYVLRTKKYLYVPHSPDRKNKNPFQLLLSYDETTRDLFFGREDELDEIIGNLFSHDKTIILGESGVGKTSFLKAAVRPVLEELDFCVVYMDDYHGGIAELKNRICRAGGITSYSSVSLTDLFKEMTAIKKRFVLILDQFEKNLTITSTSTDLLQNIAELCRSKNIGAKIVISMRDDLTTSLWKWSKNEKLELLKDAHLAWIMRMDVRRAKDIIARTLEKAEAMAETALFEQIVEDLLIVEARDTVFLPDLQIVCSRLWDSAQRARKRPITLIPKQYNHAGRASQIISDFFEKTMWQGFTKAEVPLVRQILNRLVTLEGFRQRRTLKELSDVLRVKETRLVGFLNQLIDKRLASRFDSSSGELSDARFELVHDCLAKRISEGLTKTEKECMAAGELLVTSRQDWQRHNLLIDKDRLNIIERHSMGLIFEEQDVELILLSIVREDHKSEYYERRMYRHYKVYQPISNSWWSCLGEHILGLLIEFVVKPDRWSDYLMDPQVAITKNHTTNEIKEYREHIGNIIRHWGTTALESVPKELTAKFGEEIMKNIDEPDIGYAFRKLGRIDSNELVKTINVIIDKSGKVSKDMFTALVESGQEGIKFLLGIKSLDPKIVGEGLGELNIEDNNLLNRIYKPFQVLLSRFRPHIYGYVISALRKCLNDLDNAYYYDSREVPKILFFVRLCGYLKIRKASRLLRKANTLIKDSSNRIVVVRAMKRIDPNLFRQDFKRLSRSSSKIIHNEAIKATASLQKSK